MLNAMSNRTVNNKTQIKRGFTYRSLALAKIMWLGNETYRGLFLAIILGWLCSYTMVLFSISAKYIFIAITLPVILQSAITMMVGVRASSLLANSSLHLVGNRREIFVNLICLCAILSLPAFDPKNADNIAYAKAISFSYMSIGMIFMLLFYSLQFLPMLIVSLMLIAFFFLVTKTGLGMALLAFNILLWGYFAFWLWKAPLLKAFKFENFSHIGDYLAERFRLASLSKSLVIVRNKLHVILLGEGDGYLNRILVSQLFSIVLVGLYVVFINISPFFSLWMILMQIGSAKSLARVITSQRKLWLLLDGRREQQFKVTENLVWRLYAYSFGVAIILFSLWAVKYPQDILRGFIVLVLVQLMVLAVDYIPGYVAKIGDSKVFIIFLFKMLFMALLAFNFLSLMNYLAIGISIVVLGVVCRARAQKMFMSSNFALRAS